MRSRATQEFLDLTPKAQFIKGKIDKLDFIKTKKFHSVKDPAKRMKREITDWEKVFANHISEKELTFRT